MPGEEDQIDTDELVLDDEAVVGFEDEQQVDEGDVVIAFADDEQEEETPLVKKLRDQLREAQRRANRQRTEVVEDDPEPTIPPLKRSDDPEFEWDPDRHAAYIEQRDAAVAAHAEWKGRNSERQATRQRAADEQAKRVEQQKNALGIKDYDARSETVQATLSEQQLAVLINAADDPARMIAALGAPGAASRLAMLAGEGNLARFAASVGKMEKEIKVIKKTAPAPESQVRGATATLTQTEDKHLARLEKEAEKTGDRSAIQAYRREQRRKAAA